MNSNFTQAIIRRPPAAYVEYYAKRDRVIDGELTARQHAAYVAALAAAGLRISQVAADERFPDGVFIEDTAVLCNGHALIASLQNADREGEQIAVETELRKTHKIVHLEAGAKLDGGDVMRIEDTFYVGLSGRTNEGGVGCLRNFAADFGIRTIAVPVRHCLHLKTGVTYLGNGTLLAAPGWFDLKLFEVDDVLPTGQGEEAAANTLRIHEHLLIVDGYPATRRNVEQFARKHGLSITALAVSEFQKGDGSLTCMSLIW
jgi:dimethylargininase